MATRVFSLRLPEELVAMMNAEIARTHDNPLTTPEDRTEFVRKAIAERIAHRTRSRRRRKRSRVIVTPEETDWTVGVRPEETEWTVGVRPEETEWFVGDGTVIQGNAGSSMAEGAD